jgi:hypothetical protein
MEEVHVYQLKGDPENGAFNSKDDLLIYFSNLPLITLPSDIQGQPDFLAWVQFRRDLPTLLTQPDAIEEIHGFRASNDKTYNVFVTKEEAERCEDELKKQGELLEKDFRGIHRDKKVKILKPEHFFQAFKHAQTLKEGDNTSKAIGNALTEDLVSRLKSQSFPVMPATEEDLRTSFIHLADDKTEYDDPDLVEVHNGFHHVLNEATDRYHETEKPFEESLVALFSRFLTAKAALERAWLGEVVLPTSKADQIKFYAVPSTEAPVIISSLALKNLYGAFRILFPGEKTIKDWIENERKQRNPPRFKPQPTQVMPPSPSQLNPPDQQK